MQVKRAERLLPAQPIQSFPSNKQYNPEEKATNNLLEISNQEYDFPDSKVPFHLIRLEQIQVKSNKMPLNAQQKKKSQRKVGRLSVAQNFTKSHRNGRRSSVNYLSGEQVCVMRKEKVINFSNFLVFESQDYNNIKVLPEQKYKLQQIEARPNTKSNTNNKKAISFIRKRNINYGKDYDNLQTAYSPSKGMRLLSPARKYNQSCELKRQKSELTQLQIQPNCEKQEISCYSPTFRSTSPNFRNKKVSHYFKFRLNKNP